jgi:hypothetical protein
MITQSNHKPGSHRMGRCTVIVTIDAGLWHLSISTYNQLPSYKEIKQARYAYCPNEIYMAEIFPPKEEFVNLHPYCRHLWQIPMEEGNSRQAVHPVNITKGEGG